MKPTRPRIGRARRDAVKRALDLGAPAILYCDFDHLLRWADADAGGLRATLAAQADIDVLVIGRSARAFADQPERLRLTEALVNRIYEAMTGRAWDLMFAIRRLSRRAAETIVRSSRAPPRPSCGRRGSIPSPTTSNGRCWRRRRGSRSAMRRPTVCPIARWRNSARRPMAATATRSNGSGGLDFAAQHAAVLRAYLRKP